MSRDDIRALIAEASRREADIVATSDRLANEPARRRRRRIRIAVATIVAVLACGPLIVTLTRESAAARRNHELAAMEHAQMTRFADAMCACHDATCAHAIFEQMIGWTYTMARIAPPVSPDETEIRTGNAIVERMNGCMQSASANAPP